MKTVGEILKQARLGKKITFEEVEKVTKIRKKLLIALEENNFQVLPAFIFSRGILKNYSEFLGLPSVEMIAIFKRQTKEEKENELLPKSVVDNENFLPIKITPKLTVFFISTFISSLFLFYLILQYLSFFGKPELKIYYPTKNLTVKEQILEIKGKTDPDGKLLINNQEVNILVNGNFLEKITLTKGENNITIIAKNKAGKETEKELRVNYQ